jgi:Spy/CpxP family protein refolding chaperone
VTKRIFIAIALLVCSTLAQAQQLPPGKWWRRAEIIQALELTADQQQRLDEVFRGAANDLIDARASIEKLQIAVRAELERPQVRRDELRRIANQLSDARGKLFERELMMLVDMRGVLEPEQWEKMRARLDRLQERPNQRPMQQRRRQQR